MSRRIRICYVINAFAIGGAETVVLDLARRLDAARYDVTVLAAQEPLPTGEESGEPEMRRRFREAGVRTAVLHLRTFRNPHALWKLYRFLAAGRFHIVHGHNRPTDGWAVEVGRWAGIPHRLWTRHCVYWDMAPRQLARYRRLAGKASVVLAVSETVRQACIKDEGLAPEKVVTLVNGVDTQKYAPLGASRREQVRQSLGLGAGEQLLLFVGRLSPQKAPEAFVRLVWRLRAAGRPVRGCMCGDGPSAGAVRRLMNEGPGGVELLGFRNDIPELLGATDLFVSTSRWEGLPLNIMEAMATGAAVVGPAIGQITGLMSSSPHLRAVLYAPPPLEGEVPGELVETWALAAGSLLDDAHRRSILGEEGRRIICGEYSLERMVARHDQIYRGLVGVSS